MCGAHSAIGLGDSERTLWPSLKERLRVPGQLMALMRGVLGGDTEVAVVVAVSPAGVVRPLALVVTPGIAAEITLVDRQREPAAPGVRAALVGDYDAAVLTEPAGPDPDRPLALLVTPWIFEHLTLYARKLWSRR